jgi:hypothetical protein
VIFEELYKDEFVRLYQMDELPFETPETKSVRRYLRDHQIEHTPVDIDPRRGPSATEIEQVFAPFKNYEAYKRLQQEIQSLIRQDGFAFLNSNKCEQLYQKVTDTERHLLQSANKNIFVSHLEPFYDELDHREHQIIKNIYNYSKEHKYNQGLLFMGVGHRKSIFEKAKMYESKENLKIEWTLYAR